MKNIKLFNEYVNEAYDEELIEESDMGPVKMGSMFVKKEGKSQMNGKKGMFDAVEGDTLKITGVMDDGKEFRGVVQSKYGNDQVLVSSSQLKSWERTK
jgi:predicted RNA-binding protein